MPRKSREAALMEGNPSHRPLKEDEQELEISLPEPPPHLDDVARAIWKKLGATLVKMRMVTEADWMSLAALCADWSLYQSCNETLNDEGYFFTTNTGYKSIHPLVSLRNQAIDRVLRISNQYGLSPNHASD